MWKSPSPVAKSPRNVQTNAPEYTQRMLKEQIRRTPEESTVGSYVTPPNAASGGRSTDQYPFQTPRPSTSKAVRKEKLSGNEFRQVQVGQPNSGFRTCGSIQAIPEAGVMSFTDVPRLQAHYDPHHQSMTQLHSSSFGHYNQGGLSNKQWHSCADINTDPVHFSEPLSEFTMNQSGFHDDIFIHSPKRDRQYGHLHEQYSRDFTHVPPDSYHDAYSSYSNINSGSYTSLSTQPPPRPVSRGRSMSPARSPPRIRSPGKHTGTKSPVHKSLPVKSLFEPRKDPRLETSHGSYHYDSSNYSIGSNVSARDSIQSHYEAERPVSGDLADWQQRHQMQLKRQQMDSATAQNAYRDTQDDTKYDAVKRIADQIINSKDKVILDYTSKIKLLEEKVKENEDYVKVALSLGNRDNTDMLSMKLQEFQYENDSNRAQLQKNLELKDELIEQLQQKLGGIEYENQQMKEELKNKKGFSTDEVEQLRKEVSNKENLVLEWKEKHQELVDDFRANTEKMKGLERYVSDLPTRDDYSTKSQELKTLRDNEVIFKSRISELDLSLQDAQAVLKTKDNRIQCLEKKEEDLKAKIDGFKLELERLKKPEKQGKLEHDELADIDDLRWENQKLKSDFEKAKKMLEARHKKYQQAEAKQQIRVKQLEEQISQDESMVMAMKEEMDGKEDQLKKLRTSIKELGRQNQDLMEKNMILQDKAKELDRLLSSDQQKIQRKLVREMNTSISELQSLIEICMERSQGQDPNISVLLGVRAPSMAESEEETDVNDVQALKKKLAQVRGLRKEIDKMREIISNKYAEDMGDNFNCTTS